MSRAASQAWDRIVTAHEGLDRVSTGTGFGKTPGLRIDGKIFAMVNGELLVVKLPKERVDELVDDGIGDRWGPGTGRVMKEWTAVSASHARRWPKLVAEARAFVDPRRRLRDQHARGDVLLARPIADR